MQTRILFASAISVIALVFTTGVSATPQTGRHARSHHATPAMGGPKLSATLAGSSEVPAGDPDATGSFAATLNMAHTQLCYELHVTRINAPTAAHIHIGEAGQNGAPVVMLTAPANGMSKACVAVAADMGQKLLSKPGSYYVNVHNAEFPNGGLRGQLAK